MKNFILISFLALASTSFAADCVQPEAQFKGVVTSFYDYQDDYAQIGECHFKIAIKMEDYQPSQVPGCGLDYSEVLNTTFSYDYYHSAGVFSCPVSREGEELSGYLVKKDGVISID